MRVRVLKTLRVNGRTLAADRELDVRNSVGRRLVAAGDAVAVPSAPAAPPAPAPPAGAKEGGEAQ